MTRLSRWSPQLGVMPNPRATPVAEPLPFECKARDQAGGLSFPRGDPDSSGLMTWAPGPSEHPWASFCLAIIEQPRDGAEMTLLVGMAWLSSVQWPVSHMASLIRGGEDEGAVDTLALQGSPGLPASLLMGCQLPQPC